MAVTSETSSVTYTGNNSSAVAYVIPFLFYKQEHLEVIVTDEDGVETALTLTTDYTVSGEADEDGGTLTTVAAWDNTHTIEIRRKLPAKQPFVFEEGQKLPMKTLEKSLDYLLMFSKWVYDTTSKYLPQFRTTETAVEWKLQKDVEWNELIPLDDITGPTGPTGTDGTNGTNGTNGSDASVTSANVAAVLPAAITTAGTATVKQSLGYINGEIFSSTVVGLVNAHQTANTAATANSLLCWARCLSELETGAILDELTDGACLRQGFNSPTGYKSIRNVTATIRGTVPQGPFGAIFSAATANTLTFAVADARVSTFVADFRYGENTADYATIGGLYNTGGTAVAARSVSANPGSGAVSACSVYLSDPAQSPAAVYTNAIGDESDAFMCGRYNPLETMLAVSSDNAVSPTIKAWVNGKLVLTDSTGNYQQTSTLNTVIVGAQFAGSGVYQFPLSGTFASWLLFSRVLTDAENITVAKALRALDPREENLVTYGDSRTTQIASSSNQTGNWPFQYWQSPDVCRRVRLFNIARNGWTASYMRDNALDRASWMGVNGASVKTVRAIVWSGTNDWYGGYTNAQVLDALQTLTQTLRSLGMRVTICTDVEASTYHSAPQEAYRVAFNIAVRAARHSFDSVWDLDAIFPKPRNPNLWLNTAHFNATGNEQVALNLAAGGLVPSGKPRGLVAVSKTANQVLTGGSYELITFDTEDWDTESNFASNTFTAPCDCYVKVCCGLYFQDGTPGTEIAAIYKNGVAYRRFAVGSFTNASMISGSVLVKCAAGETVDIRFYGANSRTFLGSPAPSTSTWASFEVIA